MVEDRNPRRETPQWVSSFCALGDQTQTGRQIVPQKKRFRSAEPLEISLLPIAWGSTGA
ncbi:hypothetical protein ACW9HC_09120 [Nocardia gipuzkoensis]